MAADSASIVARFLGNRRCELLSAPGSQEPHPVLQEPAGTGWDEGADRWPEWRHTGWATAQVELVNRSQLRVRVEGSRGELMGARFQRDPGERFYGFGVRSDESCRTDGGVENWVGEGPYQLPEYRLVEAITPRWAIRRRRDAAYYPVPWILSSARYGVLIDNSDLSRFRLTDEDPGWWSVEVLSSRLELRLFCAESTAELLGVFTEAVGRQPYPAAAWFLGPWCQTGQADLVPFETEAAIVEAMAAADAPVSAIETHMRRLPGGAHEGRRADERRRTDLFHRSGLASLTYLNPFVSQDYESRFGEASALLQRRADGSPYLYPAYIGGREPPITLEGQLDFSRPEAGRLLAELAREAIEDGHDGWMEDFGEYTPPDAVCADGSVGAESHNRYPVQFHAAGAEAALTAGAGRPVARFARSGWSGAAPHLPLVWGGDPTTGWGFDGLASAMTQAISAGLSGLAFFGSDIGGFFTLGGDELDHELLVRWIQLGALTPLMRTKAEGIAIPPRKRPQIWEAEVLPHWRRWAKLHTQLSPYLLGAAAQYVESGLPLVRHLCLETGTEAPDDQFLLGDHLLVAPVLAPGVAEREVAVPTGPWVDLWRSATYEAVSGGLAVRGARLLQGPARFRLPAPLTEIPLLVRHGAAIPLLLARTWSLARTPERAELEIKAFPGPETTTRFGRHGRLRAWSEGVDWLLDIDAEAPTDFRLQAAFERVTSVVVERGTLHSWSIGGGQLEAAFAGTSLLVRVNA